MKYVVVEFVFFYVVFHCLCFSRDFIPRVARAASGDPRRASAASPRVAPCVRTVVAFCGRVAFLCVVRRAQHFLDNVKYI